MGYLVEDARRGLSTRTFVGERSGTPNAIPVVTMCNFVVVLAVAVAVLAAIAGNPFVGFISGAALCGVAEAHGRCGMSHIGMIAPLRPVAPRTWLKCTLAYSIGGLSTSLLVGFVIAGLGTLAGVTTQPLLLSIVCGTVALTMLLRELQIVRFTPPQCDLQTHKMWMAEFGLVTAAGMWGSHIGLAVTTVITHGGLYAIVLIAFGGGLGNGEWMLVSFWVGRILPMWLLPWLSGKSSDGAVLLDELCEAERSFHTVAVWGLVVLLTFCLLRTFVDGSL